jgi:hypothetical protein
MQFDIRLLFIEAIKRASEHHNWSSSAKSEAIRFELDGLSIATISWQELVGPRH